MIYLRASDKAELDNALIDAGLARRDDEDGLIVNQALVDYIGIIVQANLARTRGEPITDGDEDNPQLLPGMTNPVVGFHANVAMDESSAPAALQPYIISAPATPYRVFA